MSAAAIAAAERTEGLPDEATAACALRLLAAKHTGDVAVMERGGESVTFAGIAARSAALARGLLAAGVGKGSRVAILFPNGTDFIVAFFAVARIGAVAVPVNTYFKAPELAWQLAQSDAALLLAAPRHLDHDYVARLEEALPGLDANRPGAQRLSEAPYLRSIFLSSGDAPPWARSLGDLLAAGERIDETFLQSVETFVSPADWLCIIYTSGSTAEPKGVVHTHGSLLRRAASIGVVTGIEPGDVVFNPSPFFWVGGLSTGFLASYLNGAAILAEPRFESAETLAWLEKARATIVVGWPHFAMALRREPSFPARDLSSIRGGNLRELLRPSPEEIDPGLRTTGIGMTESGGHYVYPIDEELPERLRGAFGKPVPGIEIRILDPDSGLPVPDGVPGETALRGGSVMVGYYKKEREDVFDRDGFFRTGDLAKRVEGLHFHLGRTGDMVKTGGANVSPAEVERELAGIAGVLSGHVVGLPDEERGEILAAAVVPEEGATLSEAGIRQELRSRLASFKVPRFVTFLAPGELPVLPTAKIDQRRLRARVQERYDAVRDRSPKGTA